MSAISFVDISDLSEYIGIINDINNNAQEEALIMYRGQKADYPLVPKITRIKSDKQLAGIEQEVFCTFQREAVPYLNQIPRNNWEWLSIAQHHGLPTRLLDWTCNPLVALWFTVCELVSDTDFGNMGVVWVYNPPRQYRLISISDSYNNDPFTIDKTKIYIPGHVIPRIRSQNGLFTAHKLVNNRFLALQEDVSENYLLSKKIIVRLESFGKIKNQLANYGVHMANMFPDLDGLAKHISSKYL